MFLHGFSSPFTLLYRSILKIYWQKNVKKVAPLQESVYYIHPNFRSLFDRSALQKCTLVPTSPSLRLKEQLDGLGNSGVHERTKRAFIGEPCIHLLSVQSRGKPFSALRSSFFTCIDVQSNSHCSGNEHLECEAPWRPWIAVSSCFQCFVLS